MDNKWFLRQTGNILTLLFSIFFVLIISEILIRFYVIKSQKILTAKPAKEDSWSEYDSTLGWRQISGKVVQQAYKKKIPVAINMQGIRADREYGFERKRILSVGCSFTFGHGVESSEAWPQQLENKLRSDGFDYDVINAGVCAYGIDQMHLWFIEKQNVFKPDVVILGLINDSLKRSVMTRWYTGHGKPRYRIIMDKLVLTNVPTPKKIETGSKFRDWTNITFDFNKSYLIDFFANRLIFNTPQNKHSLEELQIAKKILLDFSRISSQNNAKFFVVFMEPIQDLEKFLLENKIGVIKSYKVLRGQNDAYLKNDGHPSSRGHKLIAEQLLKFLIDTRNL